MKLYATEIAAMKARIKTLAAEGKALRVAANATTHSEKHGLKCQAQWLGQTTRQYLLAYQILQGRHPSYAESSTTREGFSPYCVTKLLPESLQETGKKQLDEWSRAIDTGKAESFKKARNRLYFAARRDMSPGKCAAQVAHAMDEWTAAHGPQQGTVIVCGVDGEAELMASLPEGGKTVLWREPDMGGQATVFATNKRLSLPLL